MSTSIINSGLEDNDTLRKLHFLDHPLHCSCFVVPSLSTGYLCGDLIKNLELAKEVIGVQVRKSR